MPLIQHEKSDVWWDDLTLQENSFYWFKRYAKLGLNGYDWMDVYQEASCRLIEHGTHKLENEWGYLRNLCRNICSEWDREITRNNNLTLLTESNSFMFSAIDHYIQKLECNCMKLLKLWYLDIPPVRDVAMIVSYLKENCGKDYKAGALHVLRDGCKKKLAQLIKQDSDDLFADPNDTK